MAILSLSSLLDRLEIGQGPDTQLDADLRAYALAKKPDWPDHDTPRLTARLDEAIALPSYLGVEWTGIIQHIGAPVQWSAAADLAKAGDESPFCRRFLIAVLNATRENPS